MKAKDVPIPHYMADLPRDHRGWPITFTSVKLPDGRYDFTTSDLEKWLYVVVERRCALCGKKHDPLAPLWWVGGPLTLMNRYFFDPPMHEECARYALKVCPYLANPRYFAAKAHLVPDHLRIDVVSANKKKPAVFALMASNGYDLVDFQGDMLVRSDDWVSKPEWWMDGQQVNAQWDIDGEDLVLLAVTPITEPIQHCTDPLRLVEKLQPSGPLLLESFDTLAAREAGLL